MTSQKKIDANRRNGSKGRGPRTRAGKLKSSLNARKHGLSVPITADRQLHGEAVKLARAIVGEGAAYNAFFEQALIIAETELDQRRAQQARLVAINMAMSETDNNIPQVEVTEKVSSSHAVNGGDTRTAEAFVRALPVLRQIERYERRAYSRRKKAAARLNDLRSLSRVDPDPSN
jgi:hypothetical protein